MPVDLKSLVTRSIAELKKTLSEKTSELAELKKELERHEAIEKMLAQDVRNRKTTNGRARTTTAKARKRGPSTADAILKGLSNAFTAKEFMKAAGRGKSPVYVRQILSRLTKRGKLKRVARGKYRKV